MWLVDAVLWSLVGVCSERRDRVKRSPGFFCFFVFLFFCFFFNDTATTEIYTLSLHDALPILFEVPPDEWTELEPKITEVMESAVALKVPLVVDASSGPNWMEAK